MYRKPGSNMTAVEVVSATYDGAIPDYAMADAVAEDARFAVEKPDYRRPTPSSADEYRIMIAHYAGHVHKLIAAKRSADAAGVVNSMWRASEVGMWFRAWRTERRALQALLRNSTNAA